MFQLKAIHPEAIPAALEKATRYRVLNEPIEAESICRDILEIDPDNQEAIINLLLALTDQFLRESGARAKEARNLVQRLESDYDRAYYSGIVAERLAKARHHQGTPHAGHAAYECLRQAMGFYEQAEKIRPPGNDDALLRWNTCARLIMRHPEIRPEAEPKGLTSHQLE